MMGILSVFTGPYAMLARGAVLALAAAVFGAFCWFKGNEHGTQKLVNYQGAQAIAAVKVNTARQVVNTQIVTKYVKVAAETKIVTETVEKEVVKYADANPGFSLDARWRVLHDAAALNAVSSTGPVADAAGGTAPTAAAAIGTVTENYAACHRTADRLDSLQAWVVAQSKVQP